MSELTTVRQRFRPEATLPLRFGDVELTVHSNSVSLDAALRRYFERYVAAAPHPSAPQLFMQVGSPVYDARRLRDVPLKPGHAPKEAFYDTTDGRVVLKRRTGVTLYVTRSDFHVVGDLVANFNQAVNAVTMAYGRVMLRRGYAMLHASATLGGTDGVAFASKSGSGKSTLALSLVDSGHRFVTNDRLFVRLVDGGVEMRGVPKRPRVNPGTLLHIPRLTPLVSGEERERYARMTPEELWALEHKRDIDVDAIYGRGTVTLAGTLHVVYVLAWGPSVSGQEIRIVDDAGRRRILRTAAKGIGVYDLTPPESGSQTKTLDAVADALRIYEVSGRTDIAGLARHVLGRPAAREA